MRQNTLTNKAILLSLIISLLMVSCSNRKLSFGIWKMKEENHEYVYLTAKEADTLGETPPAPCPSDNKLCWSEVKEIGKQPKNIKANLKPYSIGVTESGFAYLQSTKNTTKDELYEDIEWSWKIIFENRSKRGICAYGGYSLLDKDRFVLTATDTDWDNNKNGVCVKAGAQGIIQGRGLWRINAASTPYPPSRVVRGDYKLYLRHPDIFDEALMENK